MASQTYRWKFVVFRLISGFMKGNFSIFECYELPSFGNINKHQVLFCEQTLWRICGICIWDSVLLTKITLNYLTDFLPATKQNIISRINSIATITFRCGIKAHTALVDKGRIKNRIKVNNKGRKDCSQKNYIPLQNTIWETVCSSKANEKWMTWPFEFWLWSH